MTPFGKVLAGPFQGADEGRGPGAPLAGCSRPGAGAYRKNRIVIGYS
jgi:hypothetical protein